MLRFECDELLARLSDATLEGWNDRCSETCSALRLLCSFVYRCEHSCTASGVPSILRLLTICPLTAVAAQYRRPSFARLSSLSVPAVPPLERLLACLLHADCSLVLSSADETASYYLCYVSEAEVCLERLAVDAVSESTRPVRQQQTAEQCPLPSSSRLLAAASSSCTSSLHRSHRSSRSHRSTRPRAELAPIPGLASRRMKQSASLRLQLDRSHRRSGSSRTATPTPTFSTAAAS